MSNTISLNSLAKMIDHSLLHPTFTDEVIRAGCELSKKYSVATACVKPYAIPIARQILEGSGVGVCTVVGFPHGSSTTIVKEKEARQALADGATEVDMVVNIGKVLGDDWDYVAEDIKAVNDSVVSRRGIVKVIFENDYVEDSRIIKLCEICSALAVAFVKTSTGYGFVRQENGMYSYKGATEHHVRLMRHHCPEFVKLKAAGGVRTLDDLLKFRELGAERIGVTATESILEEARRRGYR